MLPRQQPAQDGQDSPESAIHMELAGEVQGVGDCMGWEPFFKSQPEQQLIVWWEGAHCGSHSLGALCRVHRGFGIRYRAILDVR
jgi:hypothetical protein